ncbi:MAG: PAS domain S-box protein [Bacteroidota bacterium]
MCPTTPSSELKILKKEVERLKSLFEDSSMNYQSLDADGNIVEVNTAWLNTLGYDEEDVMDKWFGEILSDESKEKFAKEYQTLKTSDARKNLELTLICKDGSKIYANFTCLGNHSNSKSFTGSHCVFQNITKLRLTEEALRASEKKYSQLIELSNVGFFELDPVQKKFTYLNDIIKRVLGVNEESLEDFRIEERLTEISQIHFRDRLKRLNMGLEVPNIVEYEVITRKGETIWIQVHNSHVRNEDGKIRIIGVVQEISERKKLELQLQNYYDTLEQITNNNPAVIFQLRQENSKVAFTHVSSNIKELTGYSEEEIERHPSIIQESMNPEDLHTIIDLMTESAKSGNPAHLTYRLKRADGNTRWVKTVLSPKTNKDNHILWTGVSSDITDEIELKQKLSQSEERYKALVFSAAPGISTMTRTGIVTSVNPRLCEISGYSEEELVGKHFLKIPAFFTKDTSKYLTLYKNAMKGLIPAEPVQFEWKHKNGERRWGEGFLSAIIQDKKRVGYQGVLTDTTNRTLQERAEAKRKEELNLLFESAVTLQTVETEKDLYEFLANQVSKLIPDSVIGVTSESDDGGTLRVEAFSSSNKTIYNKILWLLQNNIIGRKFPLNASEPYFEVTGRLSIKHKTIYDLTFGQIPKIICDQMEKVIDLGPIYEISIGTSDRILGGAAILLKKNHEIKDPGIIETLFREASSALIRLRTLKMLDQSEKLYRSLAESSGDWIIRFNKQFKHIYVNQAVLQTFNKSYKDFKGKRCQSLGYSNEYSKLIESRLALTMNENTKSQCDIELTIDGKSDFYEWCFYPELSVKGVVETVLVNARNITKRKEMEGELLETVSKRNKLYSIITHDLRAPFNSMLGFLKILEERYPDLKDEKRLDHIRIVKKAAQNCLSLFNSILQWSTDYKDQESHKPVYFDLKGAVGKAIDLSNATIVDKKLKILNDVAPDTLVHADYNMIYTVLRNLISNATHFSNSEGVIIITALDQKKNVVCKVQDFGSGISKEDIDRILNDKGGVNSPGKSEDSSFGFGLKLTKEFITSNSGKLWIESEPGEGTSVFFTLEKK